MRKVFSMASVVVFILLFSVLLSAVGVDLVADEMQYQQYFATEEVLQPAPLSEWPEKWCAPIVFSAEEIANPNPMYYPQLAEKATPGTLYLIEKDDADERFLTVIAEGNYTQCYCDGRYFFAVENGTDFVRFDIHDWSKPEVLFSVKNPIRDFCGYGDLIFYLTGDTIYRYYIPAGRLDKVVTQPNLTFWAAKTNQSVYVSVPNANYLEAMQVIRLDDDGLIANVDEFRTWAKENTGQVYSGFLEKLSVDEVLSQMGIPMNYGYYFNADTQKANETCEALDRYCETAESSALKVNSASATTSYSASGAVRDYQTNSYFSNTNVACRCHTDRCSLGGCDCRYYDFGIQCCGYARYVYHEDNQSYAYTEGFPYELRPKVEYTLPNNPDPYNAETEAFFEHMAKTAYVRLITKRQEDHKIAITASDNYYVTFCHANAATIGGKRGEKDNCRVENDITLSYVDFFVNYPKIEEVKTPCKEHVASATYSTDGTQHWKVCINCGKDMTARTNHVASSTYSTDGTYHWEVCTVCGKEVSARATHTVSAGYQHNMTHHWRFCSVCGYAMSAKQAHSYLSPNYNVCSVCKYRKPEINRLPGSGALFSAMSFPF